jgi:hypothetical protein
MAPGSEQLSPTAALIIALVFLSLSLYMAFCAMNRTRLRWAPFGGGPPSFRMSTAGTWTIAAFSASAAVFILAFAFTTQQWVHVLALILVAVSFIAMKRQVSRDRAKWR